MNYKEVLKKVGAALLALTFWEIAALLIHQRILLVTPVAVARRLCTIWRVEIYDNARWRGIDPTQNHLISNGYIKIAHGRDADDCPLNRGIYMGHTDENMLIKVNVTSQQ
jgi:hypothetical protein